MIEPLSTEVERSMLEKPNADEPAIGDFTSVFIKGEPEWDEDDDANNNDNDDDRTSEQDKSDTDDNGELLEPEIIVHPENKEFQAPSNVERKPTVSRRQTAKQLDEDEDYNPKEIKRKKKEPLIKEAQTENNGLPAKPAGCETCGGACSPQSCDNIRTNEAQTVYGCGLCENRVFKLLKSLKIHLKMHSGLYQCGVCGKRVSNNSQLREHTRTHTKEKPFSCPTCKKAFSYSCKLKEHIRTHSGELPYACPMCPERFARSDHMRRHMTQHTGEMYLCEFESCDRVFSCKSSLNEHMKKHIGLKPFKCDVCGKAFAKSTKLRIHQRTHTGEKPWSCEVCHRTWSYIDKYKKHKSAIQNGDFVCTFCEARLCSRFDLRSHMKSKHGDESPHACTLCDRTFKTRPQLSVHMRSHRPRLNCAFCDKTYLAASDLRIHESSHQGELALKCKQCDEKFSSRYNLKRHVQSAHSTSPPVKYHCPVCPATFATSFRLKTHSKKHVGDTLYECEVCNVGFNTSGSLKHHLRVHREDKDDNVKPFACEYCDKTFKYNSSLLVHSRRHTGVDFKCPICARGFFRRERVRKHMLAVHQTSLENFYDVKKDSNNTIAAQEENSSDKKTGDIDSDEDEIDNDDVENSCTEEEDDASISTGVDSS